MEGLKNRKKGKKKKKGNVFVICFLFKEKQQWSAASSDRFPMIGNLIASTKKKKKELVPF